MNCQAVILLDPFTKLNGGTGLIPGSQVKSEWPDRDYFFKNCHQVEGEVCMVLTPAVPPMSSCSPAR